MKDATIMIYNGRSWLAWFWKEVWKLNGLRGRFGRGTRLLCRLTRVPLTYFWTAGNQKTGGRNFWAWSSSF